jgi:hypothetical protein
VTRVLAAGIAIALMAAFLPVYPLAQTSEPSSSDQPEYVQGGVEEEMVGGLRLARGKHGRRMWRTSYWVNSLTGDKARVFDSYGMPSSRYREDILGRVEETWTYLEQGVEITFHGDKIVRTEKIFPTQRPNAGW